MLADAMLGKLARWLRVLGYDAVYMQGEDPALAHRARAEDRILLTRDRELSRRRGLSAVLISSQSLPEQIAQVVTRVGPIPEGAPARCMTCNAPLERISVETARASVPPYVAKTQKLFHRCPECGRIYWRGTHWEGIERQIQEALATVD